MGIEWSYLEECEANPDYDLCGRSFGKYVDVIQHGEDGIWSVTYDNAKVADNIIGRDDARSWAEANLGTQEGIIAALLYAYKHY